MPEWAVKAFEEGILYFDALTPDTPPIELFIKTLEGTMHAPVGSYVKSLYWSVNKNMEIIKNITEVSDVYFNVDKWNSYDGYCIETDSRQLYFVINNGQDCCENWGYLSSEDDFGSFIGSELKNVYVTDTKLGTIVSNMKEDLDAGSAMFINVETTRGLLQFAAYNEHNGYYGHDVLLVSKYDDKTVIEADDVL
nr:MAG: PGDYG protein [Bacteriophage sp.]